jgi:hypothetical protein
MLAHRQGAPLNAAELERSIGGEVKTIIRYLDMPMWTSAFYIHWRRILKKYLYLPFAPSCKLINSKNFFDG